MSGPIIHGMTSHNAKNDPVTGPRGPAGPKGDKGEPGEKGYKGDKGERGLQGLPGRDGIDGRNGRDGKDGSVGPKGDTGEAGRDGKDGLDGEDGSRWYNGDNNPSKSLGEDHDYYLNNITNDYFEKVDSSWVKRGNIKGMPGGSGGSASVIATSGVQSVVAGTNVTVDNTDPQNPIVSATGGGGDSSPLTTKGDIYTYDTDNARLGVGTDGQVLKADSSTATGLKWEDDNTNLRLEDEENNNTYAYVGNENTVDGSWFIYRRTIASNVREYATGASDYATNWTNRSGLSYS